MNNAELVYRITSYIPSGKVATYGQLADYANIKNPRHIGQILHKNPRPGVIPCHRVVNAKGKLAQNFGFGGALIQEKILNQENLSLQNGRLDLSRHLWQPTPVLQEYFNLLKLHGDPGPWPWFNTDNPHTDEEIAIGAVLTQNTNWQNVVKALENLRQFDISNLNGIYQIGNKDYEKLKLLIRPSGYFNQKAKRLYAFSEFIKKNYGSLVEFLKLPPDKARLILLSLHGIGPETADTILLYSGNRPIFVIDAYTKKFVLAKKWPVSHDYDSLQNYFMQNLPQSTKLYQDYHALIVRWSQQNPRI